MELDNERKQYKIFENIINKYLNKEKYNNENNQEKIVVKEKIIKNDMEAGTSCYTYNIQELKDESNNKTKLILKLSDEQNDYKDQLNKDWKTILYDNMYLTGNWYLSDDKIEFLIPAYLLGFDETTARVISIGVKVDQDF